MFVETSRTSKIPSPCTRRSPPIATRTPRDHEPSRSDRAKPLSLGLLSVNPRPSGPSIALSSNICLPLILDVRNKLGDGRICE